MAQASPPSRPSAADSGDSAPAVRLEVRSGLGRATAYEVGDGGFLIGSVPGCDLRLPGCNLPPIICLIARGPTAVSLRRLAPVLPILVNGQAVAAAYLQDGDCVAIGPIVIVLAVAPGKSTDASGESTPAPVQRQEQESTAAHAELERQEEENSAAR